MCLKSKGSSKSQRQGMNLLQPNNCTPQGPDCMAWSRTSQLLQTIKPVGQTQTLLQALIALALELRTVAPTIRYQMLPSENLPSNLRSPQSYFKKQCIESPFMQAVQPKIMLSIRWPPADKSVFKARMQQADVVNASVFT